MIDEGGGPKGVNEPEEEGGGPAGVVEGLFDAPKLKGGSFPGVEGGLDELGT